MTFSTLPARAVCVALFAFSVGCASTEPSEPQVATLIATSSGVESFEISYVVNGKPMSETVTTPWSFVIDLNGEFDISVIAKMTDASEAVGCKIQLGEPGAADADLREIAEAATGTATCRMFGTIDGDDTNVDVESSKAALFQDGAPDTITLKPTELLGGAFRFDLPNTWSLIDYSELFVDLTESVSPAQRDFSYGDLERVALATDELSDENDGSKGFGLKGLKDPRGVSGSALDIAGAFVRDWRERNGADFGTITDPVEIEIGGVMAAQFIISVDGSNSYENFFRIGDDLFVLDWDDVPDASYPLDDVLDSLVIDVDRLS